MTIHSACVVVGVVGSISATSIGIVVWFISVVVGCWK